MTDQKRLEAVAEAVRDVLRYWEGKEEPPHGIPKLRRALDALDSPLPTDEELLELATDGHPIAPSAVAATLAAMQRGYAHALRAAADHACERHGTASLAAKELRAGADEMKARS